MTQRQTAGSFRIGGKTKQARRQNPTEMAY